MKAFPSVRISVDASLDRFSQVEKWFEFRKKCVKKVKEFI